MRRCGCWDGAGALLLNGRESVQEVAGWRAKARARGCGWVEMVEERKGVRSELYTSS